MFTNVTRSLWLCLFLPAFSVPAMGQGTLVWSDEFDGSTIDPANWEYMIGDGTAYGLPPGWGNNELQYYTDRPENSYAAGGYLHIVADEESFAGYGYTSARLRSRNRQDFRYGRIEARLQLPTGQGMWPAFWMLPTNDVYGGWAASGEIDIMESSNIPTTIHGTIHFGGAWPANNYSGGTFSDGTDFSSAFHDYAVEWEGDVIRWYIDGAPYFTETSAGWYSDGAPGNARAPFDQYFHLLLNIAVGGNFPGPPDSSTTFPQEMLIDWIRVYDLQAPHPSQPHAIPGLIEAEDFDSGGQGVSYHDCDAANNGGAYRPGYGVDIEVCAEGGFDIGWICADEWLEYTVYVQTAGTYTIDTRVASPTTGGIAHIEFDGIDKTGDIPVPVTGGWQSWATVTTTADLAEGVQVMRFVNSDNPTDAYNLNYFDISFLCAKGDVNQDTRVDGLDVQPFVEALINNEPPGTAEFCAADIDGDGTLEIADDLPAFVNCLIAGMCP